MILLLLLFKIYLFILFFSWAGSCSLQALLFVVVRGLLIVVASCCRAQALGARASADAAPGR